MLLLCSFFSNLTHNISVSTNIKCQGRNCNMLDIDMTLLSFLLAALEEHNKDLCYLRLLVSWQADLFNFF